MADRHERIEYLDELKGLAAFLVVLGHLVTAKQEYRGIYNFIYSFHMPLFMFVSGVTAVLSFRRQVFSERGQLSSEARFGGKWNYLARRFLNIMVPYLSWCILLPVISSLLHGGGVDWQEEFESMFVTNTAYWFLPTLYGLIVSYMLYVIIADFVRRKMGKGCEEGSDSLPGKGFWMWKEGLVVQLFAWCVTAALFLILYLLTEYQLFRDMIGYMIPFSLAVLYTENGWVKGLFHKKEMIILCVFCYAALFPQFDFDHASVGTSLRRMLLGMYMIVVLLYLFADRKLPGVLQKMFTFWGKYTLLIYILHTVMMGWCKPLEGMVTGRVLVFVWYCLLSGIICSLCCIVGMSLSHVPVVRILCLGKGNRR